MRWLVALISDTGMRPAEAAGLKTGDLKLNHEHPHISLKPYAHRSLKTKASERVIPVVSASLWAAQRIVASTQSEFCFPRYTKSDSCNSNSASAAIDKWVKTVVGNEAVYSINSPIIDTSGDTILLRRTLAIFHVGI